MTRHASDGTEPPDKPNERRMRRPDIAYTELDLREIPDRVIPGMMQRAERHDQRQREQREQPANQQRRRAGVAT
jgi:hypothetical protein